MNYKLVEDGSDRKRFNVMQAIKLKKIKIVIYIIHT